MLVHPDLIYVKFEDHIHSSRVHHRRMKMCSFFCYRRTLQCDVFFCRILCAQNQHSHASWKLLEIKVWGALDSPGIYMWFKLTNVHLAELTLLLIELLLHLFNGHFSRTTWVSRHRKVNHSGFYWSKRWWGDSGISWTICKSFAPRSRQISMPVPHHSVFTGRMPFLPSSQHCQSTEGTTRPSSTLLSSRVSKSHLAGYERVLENVEGVLKKSWNIL